MDSVFCRLLAAVRRLPGRHACTVRRYGPAGCFSKRFTSAAGVIASLMLRSRTDGRLHTNPNRFVMDNELRKIGGWLDYVVCTAER